MVHRALMGSVERFFAILTEHYAGAFPVWLAPIQARLISIGDRQTAYCDEVAAQLTAAGFGSTPTPAAKLEQKIRQAQLEKVPFMLVCGDRRSRPGGGGADPRRAPSYRPWPSTPSSSTSGRRRHPRGAAGPTAA
ncbi:MAG: hypothetical protein IPL61_22970 [Myxococcales bacterium]|nr:hypothetical protein [Myxococcales bacterium]